MPVFAAQLAFAGTIFTSAFALFLVQPIIAKQILPWFGGSAAVWTTCMVFFQVVLLVGYAYSDWISRRLAPLQQVLLHVALLAVSLSFMPIVASTDWRPTAEDDPSMLIIRLLLGTIGLPYFLLSTTGPLVQSWVSRTFVDSQVYRYFSLSNLASLLALIGYPFLIEPRAAMLGQAYGWSAGYGLFTLACAASGYFFVRRAAASAQAAPVAALAAPTALLASDYLQWLAPAAMGSWLLLAVTNHISQNVASVPFLWLLPLTLYLLTFVLCFESDRWYRRGVVLPIVAVLLGCCAYGLEHSRVGVNIWVAVPLYSGSLFFFCLFLHGELARLRPGPRHLTRFYLMLSLGGAAGGIVVGLIAPRVLPACYELGIGLVLTALLALGLPKFQPGLRLGALGLAALCGYFLYGQIAGDVRGSRLLERNFYGTLLTLDTHRTDPNQNARQLYHGSIKHGEQFLATARRREATSYYGATSGIGLALANTPAEAKKVGVIGLGAGTLAVYGKAGDSYRLYEINPAVIGIAQTEFSFIADSPAQIELVVGDARRSLETESPQAFDVLAVDAFSGDSIPVHLVTAQAMTVYLRHLKPAGIVAFHVTNRFLNLAPVIAAIAAAQNLHVALIRDDPAPEWLRSTDWVLVSRSAASLDQTAISAATTAITPIPGLSLWTDDFNNLFEVLR